MEKGESMKFSCTAHDRNEAMSSIPAKLCKQGIRAINSAEDSGPVSLACDAVNGLGPITVCACEERGSNISRSHNDNASPTLTHLQDLSVVIHEGMSCISWAAGKRINQAVHNYGADRLAPTYLS